MNNNKTPFCKVCFDSGKPDTKHWVKDRNGKVCCPTLLALKCRLCDQCGHTVKYCSKAAVAPQPKKVQPYKEQAHVAPLAPVPQQKAPINKYDLLFNDDSDEEQEEQEEQVKVKVKKPEQEVKKQQPKRWIDYDSDFDDEPLPIPTLKRYGHSDQSDESFVGARM